jgi:FAD/FMN-containing dehydrogenase
MWHHEEYREIVQRASHQIQAMKNDITKGHKADGHEFRNKYRSAFRLDLSHFNKVLALNEDECWVDVGGMMKYSDLVHFCMHHHSSRVVPAIVPELLSITVGGAISGIGIETASFKYGLVHDTCLEMEVLTSDGKVVVCSPHNEYSDLFTGMPNSYGTLGYILRARIQLIPSKHFIQIQHLRFDNIPEALKALEDVSNDTVANTYLEGIVYSPTDIRILRGTFCDALPHGHHLKDYNLHKPFYKSIHENDLPEMAYMDLYGYISRWDVDGFWGTAGSILENSWVRYFTRNHLKTELFLSLSKNQTFQNVYNFFSPKNTMAPAEELGLEKITTDNGIPVENWLAYSEWYFQTFPDSNPLWLCPFRTTTVCPLLKVKTNHLYCDFGTFNFELKSIDGNKKHWNETIEKKIFDLDGMKCFYSMNCNPDYYDTVVDHSIYMQLKDKYDPSKKFPLLKDKVFL